MAGENESTNELIGIADSGVRETDQVPLTDKEPIEVGSLDGVEFLGKGTNEEHSLVQQVRGNQTEHCTKIKSKLDKEAVSHD
jgi:hypothetical protein